LTSSADRLFGDAGPVWLGAKLAAFGRASNTIDERLFTQAALAHARRSIDHFIARHAHAVAAESDGVVALLEGWARSTGGSAGLAFEPSFGDAWRCAAAEAIDPERAGITAASLALHLSACGVVGDWEIALRSARRLRCGSLLLPGAHRLSVRSGPGVVSVTTSAADGHRVCRLPLSGAFARSDSAAWYASVLPRVEVDGASIRLLTWPALESAMGLDEESSRIFRQAFESIESRQIDCVRTALELIAAQAPAYLPWVSRAVHDLVLLNVSRSSIDSASVADSPGLIYLSAREDAASIAERLVHESARQHVNLLTTLGPAG
jgi:HEXXH motif-containing protein